MQVKKGNDKILRAAIRNAARLAFTAVLKDHPGEHFYYFALVTTGDALRPGPSASSIEGLERVVCEYKKDGYEFEAVDLRWSEADSPYNLYGDEYFKEVENLFLQNGDHRNLPESEYKAKLIRRYEAMEGALLDLDMEGFFGKGTDRHSVLINVVVPGDESEEEILERAAKLNPIESLVQIRKDLKENEGNKNS